LVVSVVIAGVLQPTTLRLAATGPDCMAEIITIAEINRVNVRAQVPVQYVFNCEAAQ